MKRGIGLVAVLAVGLAGGLGIARITFDEDGPGDPQPTVGSLDVAPPDQAPDIRPAAQIDVGPGAPDARSAVDAFLAAEAADGFDESYRLLSGVDRARYRSSDGWRAAHESLPPITGFHVDTVAAGRDGRATAAVLLELRPSLDEVVGLVPAAADATVVTVEEADGWRVAYGEGTLRPRYLPDGTAPAAVRAWAEARQRCEPAEEYRGGLVAFPALADELCGADGAVDVSAAASLPDVDAARFVSAFGPDVLVWSRVVTVESPVRLRAVVAPVGDRWLVIGLLQ